MTTLPQLGRQVAGLLAAQDRKVVFAESCTAGMVAASLAAVPGISNYLCGSAVTYRTETKAAWLRKIARSTLIAPGPVSSTVAKLMADEVLAMTPEADLAAAVTGHLGPDAPSSLDGIVYIGLAIRHGRKVSTSAHRKSLMTRSRVQRQREATRLVLEAVRDALGDA